MTGEPRGKRRVLVVDDDEDARIICTVVLEKYGYDVATAHDGMDGMLQAWSDPPDVILLDIKMPVMDGLQAIAALRNDSRTRNIPALAMTAHAMMGERDALERAGFDAVLFKPIEPATVVGAVRKFAREWIG